MTTKMIELAKQVQLLTWGLIITTASILLLTIGLIV